MVCNLFTRGKLRLLLSIQSVPQVSRLTECYASTETTYKNSNTSTSLSKTGIPSSGIPSAPSYNRTTFPHTFGATVTHTGTSDESVRTPRSERQSQSASSYGRVQNSSVTSARNSSSRTSQHRTITAPATLKYKDPNLTGCYAGTGGSTTFTLTSGDYFWDGNSEIIIGATPQTFRYSCSEFFSLGNLPWDLKLSFARSPACASYAHDKNAGYIPGVKNGDAHIPYDCCGGCKIFAPEVQLLYWPSTSSTDCTQPNATITSQAKLFPQSIGPADSSQPQAANYAVVDESTLTFPSLYIAIHGTVSVADSCGIRGNVHYNPTIAVPPGDLSTLSFGSTYVRLAGFEPQTEAYDPAACHTYGLSNGSTTSYLNKNGGSSRWITTVAYTMGPPYNPILLPPAQLTALDPEWGACTAWDSYGDNAYDVFFGLYDPPRALSRASAMADPSITSAGSIAPTTASVPQPASAVLPAGPGVTSNPPVATNPVSSKPPVPADPNPPKDPSPDEGASTTGLAGFILQPFGPSPSAGVNEQNSQDPKSPAETSVSPSLNQPVIPHDLGQTPPDPIAPFVNNVAPPTTASSKVNIISPNALGSTLPVLTIGGNAYTANQASQYIIGSQTLALGGSTILVNGAPYSLAPAVAPAPIIAGNLGAVTPDGNPVLTINGKAYTANSASQYIIGSQTLTPGGPGVTINNVPYSLPSNPTAIISGGQTIALGPKNTVGPDVLPPARIAGAGGSNNPSRSYTVAGVVMIGNPSSLVVGSTTLTPGSPPLITSGHSFSIAAGGALVFDGTTTILPADDSATGAPGSGNNELSQIYTVDGIQLTKHANTLAVDGETLTPGSPPLIISGHTFSLVNGDVLVVDGRTSTLLSGKSNILTNNGAASPTIGASGSNGDSGSQTYTVAGIAITGSPNTITVGGMTLMPGSPPITIAGHSLSLATGGALVIDGSTTMLPTRTLIPPSNSMTAGSTIGFSGNNPSQVYTVNGMLITGSPSALVVDGKTLTPGSPPLTVSGHIISLVTGGTLVVDDSTTTLASGAVAPTAGNLGPGAKGDTGAFAGSGNRAKPVGTASIILVLVAFVCSII